MSTPRNGNCGISLAVLIAIFLAAIPWPAFAQDSDVDAVVELEIFGLSVEEKKKLGDTVRGYSLEAFSESDDEEA